MTAALDKLVDQLKQLSLDELLTLQERIIGEVRSKTHPETTPLTDPGTETNALGLKVWKWENWPADSTFRREDIYDDDGR
jgi:hypothetical protein